MQVEPHVMYCSVLPRPQIMGSSVVMEALYSEASTLANLYIIKYHMACVCEAEALSIY